MADGKKSSRKLELEIDGDFQPWELFGGATLQAKRTKSRTDRKASFNKRLAKRRKKQKQARKRK